MNKRFAATCAWAGSALGLALLWASLASAQPVAKDAPDAAAMNSPEIQAAMGMLQRGDLSGAVKQLDEAAKKQPELPPGKVVIAQQLLQAGQMGLASQFLEQAGQETPDVPEPFAMLGDFALRDQRWLEADLLFQRALQAAEALKGCPKRQANLASGAHKGLAMTAEARKDWAGVQKHAEAALKGAPGDALALQQLGQALFFQSKPEEALAKFREAAKADPKLRTPEVSLAFLYEQSGNREKAAQAMVEALKAKPRDLQTRLDAVQWTIETGQLDQAQAQTQAAVQLDPKSVPAQTASGMVALLRKDYPAAEEAFQKAHLLEPETPALSNKLALALVEQDDEAKRLRAQKFVQINRRLAPQDADTLATFGWVAYKRGQLEVAEPVLNQVMQSPGVGPDALYYRARLATDRKDLATARRLLEGALNLKGTFIKRQEAEQLLKDLK